jgi:anti-anti-sigma factor
MQYHVEEKAGTATLHLAGQVVVGDRAEFETAVSETLSGNPQKVVVDLEGVEYMDSAGLGLLLMLRDEAGTRQTRLLLGGAQGQVAELFEAAGFELLFEFASR